ncbi:MAG: phosphotransferase family protein [Alphaproteobacteria bacterium]|nr:phosphotransferase family protein [Alphaproteobacteria bacterium SS10]
MSGDKAFKTLRDPARLGAALSAYLVDAWGATRVEISGIEPLSGGAIQQNIAFEAKATGGEHPGSHYLVLRTDAQSAVDVSINRLQEFEVLKAAHAAGVTVPEPVLGCADRGVIGQPFALMGKVAGEALGRKLVRDPQLVGDAGDALVHSLGGELAKLHQITPDHELAVGLEFLPVPPSTALAARLTLYRGFLDAIDQPQPALEWGLRWLERNMPENAPTCLVHADFRTGNYLVDGTQLSAILDWEFASWSAPMEDVGWFMARCWRFGRRDREAGGLGSREALYAGYDEMAAQLGLAHRIDPNLVPYWEVMALIRWGIIALQQGQRTDAGGEASLELALTGPIALETAYDMIHQIDEITGAAA